MKKYPCIGSKRKLNYPSGSPCFVCGISPSTMRVDIEIDWFRGDDEVVRVCDRHSETEVLEAFRARREA